jgi:spermidine/putrescine transport system ATP-binding protein
MIAGFVMPTSGEILFYDEVLNEIPPYERPINTVFQNYALFPHMNVLKTLRFPLNIKG